MADSNRGLLRVNSVQFTLRDFRNPRLTNIEILNGVKEVIPDDTIKGIQVLIQNCVITIKDEDAKNTLKAAGFSLRNRHITVSDVEKSITKVTLKDAPVELNDACLVTMLQPYGDVVPESLTRGKIKGSNIETGTRYLQMVNVKHTIPAELNVGRFAIRTFCDNGKSACTHCESTTHLTYACPQKPPPYVKRCWRCNGSDHFIADCPNEIVCRGCGKSGHEQKYCPNQAPQHNGEHNTMGPIPGKHASHPHVLAFRGQQDVLSNLYIVKEGVYYDGKRFNSVEHGYKAQKANYHEREDLIQSVDLTHNARTMMKYVDKELENVPIKEEWISQRQRIMKTLVSSKAQRCPEFRQTLLDSKDKILVEATSHPLYASGLPGIQETYECPPEEWPGKNRLGEIMMEVRMEIINKEEDKNTDSINNTDEGDTTQQAAQALTQVTLQDPNNNTKPSTSNSVSANMNTITIIQDRSEANTVPNAASTPKLSLLKSDLMEASTDGIDAVSTPTHTPTLMDNNDDGVDIVLGDSLLSGVAAPDGMLIVAESGASLDTISPLIERATKATKSQLVNSVVIALGVNDLNRTKSSGATNALFNTAVEKVKSSFPDTNTFISGVIPRRETHESIKQCNDKIVEVNNYLREAAKPGDFGFIGNSNTFNKALHEQYHKKQDPSGLHLNTSGQKKLVAIIQDALTKKTQSIKRSRSEATPDSVKKDTKSRKVQGQEGKDEKDEEDT